MDKNRKYEKCENMAYALKNTHWPVIEFNKIFFSYVLIYVRKSKSA